MSFEVGVAFDGFLFGDGGDIVGMGDCCDFFCLGLVGGTVFCVGGVSLHFMGEFLEIFINL